MDEKTLEIAPILLEADEVEPMTQHGVLMEEGVIPLEIEDLSDSTITEDLISELKLKGFIKPKNVSLKKWTEAPLLSTRLKDLVLKAAEGARSASLAKALSLPETEVREWLKHPVIELEIKSTQELIFGKDHRKKLEYLTPKALDVAEEILENPLAKDQIRLQAATYIIDQAIGKSKQELEVKGSLLLDVMRQIEQLPEIPRVPSKMEQLANSVLPDAITVGKRNG